MLIVLLKGLILGLLIAIPIGPIGVLCVQRTLAKGRLSGFISGLGAATADGFYGAVVAFGLMTIIHFLQDQQTTLRLVGGIFLLYTGIKTIYTKPRPPNRYTESGGGLFGDYLSTLFLTIINPTTIISFTALFAGIGIGTFGNNILASVCLVTGVFFGSTLWWLLLCFGVTWMKTRTKNFSLEIINKLSGVIIALFAVVVLLSLIG